VIVAGIVAVLVVAWNILGWPTRPNVPNEAITTGIVVAVRSDVGTGTDFVIFGYSLADGTQLFPRVPISQDGAHPGYSWFSLGGGQDIRVAYNSAQPDQSVPYRAFPVWSTISLASVLATVAFILGMLAKDLIIRISSRRPHWSQRSQTRLPDNSVCTKS
jgi:hypothetical protein